jgi:hypothetical protein
MTIDRQHIDATKGEKVIGTFFDRAVAEKAVEKLHAAGFNDDQITMTTIGGQTAEDGTFKRGHIEVSVLADARADEAEKILTAASPS